MKLSFSTNGWQGISWSEFAALAKDAAKDRGMTIVRE